MRILLITKNIENKGGLGRYSYAVMNELSHKGFTVSVVTECDYLLELSGVFAFAKFLINILKTRIRAKDFDIIHALDGWPYGVYGYFAIVCTERRLFINGVGTYSAAPLKEKFKNFFLKKAYLRANQIFCISDYTKKRILENIKLSNITTIFMGTNKLPVLKEREIREYKERYKIKNNFPVLLTIGDIKDRKGQLDTLKAASFLKKEHPNFKYVMIGSDEEKYYVQNIKDYARENNLSQNFEIISGMYDDKILSFFYQICDIFVMNSINIGEHFEGFGLVLLEAARFGKPVIGSRDCGIESALKDGYNGYLTEQGNPEDIKDKILLALKNKETLSKNSKEFAKNFSWDKTVLKYVKFYKL